ncbi:MAG: T9SS type A sorting domain-containing protein [Bacteroidia bacterium]|nr:T9SS type A sorting domain-containing protein [Bacteroidia bacterium]
MFPNPVKDQLTLDFPGVLSNQVAVFDIWGRQMEISKSALSEQLNLDFSQFAPGVYLITVNKDGKKLSRKIIKE